MLSYHICLSLPKKIILFLFYFLCVCVYVLVMRIETRTSSLHPIAISLAFSLFCILSQSLTKSLNYTGWAEFAVLLPQPSRVLRLKGHHHVFGTLSLHGLKVLQL